MSRIQDEHDDDIELYDEAASSRKHADHVGNIRTLGFAVAMKMKEKVQTLPQPVFEKALREMENTSLYTPIELRESK